MDMKGSDIFLNNAAAYLKSLDSVIREALE